MQCQINEMDGRKYERYETGEKGGREAMKDTESERETLWSAK